MASYTENFDGVTAPTLPGTISTDAGTFVTSATASHSGSNSIRQSSASSSDEFHSVSSGVGADATLTAWFNMIGLWTFTGAFFGIRRQSGGSGYFAEIKQGSSDSFQGIQLYKRSGSTGGTYTAIGPVVSFSISAGSWYMVKIVPSGSSIKVRLQRASDSNWLTSAASWGASEVDAISQTDSTYSSAGECMLSVYGSSSFDYTYFDDITYADAVTATASGFPCILD